MSRTKVHCLEQLLTQNICQVAVALGQGKHYRQIHISQETTEVADLVDEQFSLH